MSPQPNWLVNVGMAKETGPWGIAVRPPTTWLSCSKPVYAEKQTPIWDRGLRGIRSEAQAMVFGEGHTEVDFPDMPWYGDDSPHLIMALLGADTVTGAGKTGTIGAVSAGAVTLTYTVVAGGAPVLGDIFKIDTGTAVTEIVVPTNITGAGPYTLTVPAIKYGHLAAAPTAQLYKHVLTTLNTAGPPSYTAAKYDALVATAREVAGLYFEEINLKMTNPGAFTVGAKGRGKLATDQTKGTPAYSQEIFQVPWQASVLLAGVANARLVDIEIAIKAPNDQIFGMAATQSPTAAVSDQLTVTGKLTIVPDDYTEYRYYLNNTQPALVVTIDNGMTRTIFQMSKCAFTDPVQLDHSGNYSVLNANFEALANSTDAGASGIAPIKVEADNLKSAAY